MSYWFLSISKRGKIMKMCIPQSFLLKHEHFHYGVLSLIIFVQTRLLCIVYKFTQKLCLFTSLSVRRFSLFKFRFRIYMLLFHNVWYCFFNKLTMLYLENTARCSVCAISRCVSLPCGRPSAWIPSQQTEGVKTDSDSP